MHDQLGGIAAVMDGSRQSSVFFELYCKLPKLRTRLFVPPRSEQPPSKPHFRLART
jgi:hypothetical protein